jgi:hypothetical protein
MPLPEEALIAGKKLQMNRRDETMKTLVRVFRCALMVLVLWGVFFSCRAASASPLPIPPFPYREQGLFVQAPAVIGGALFAVPGAVIGPVVCLVNPPNRSQNLLKSLGECSAVGALLSSIAGSAIVGFPFYVVKQIFWDLPLRLLGIDRPPAATEARPTDPPGPPLVE